jgi:hypothetical protein
MLAMLLDASVAALLSHMWQCYTDVALISKPKCGTGTDGSSNCVSKPRRTLAMGRTSQSIVGT